MDEILVLVDKHDNPIGSAGKADIHQKGTLHRAFSIFIEAAAHRRLGEEMGFDCPLKKVSSFIYHAIPPNDLIEYEYNHVFIGRFDKEPIINLDEVSDYKWVNPLKLRELINNAPDVYTVWFKKIINGFSYQDIEEWQGLI
ncbi:isopentenyl-diphosphate Delta-isomerase [Photorhabdus sp. CRCIA-P01]|uniref:isopentenyl-diphosphate Delta-isomerase n=1 Tax=Photorhabdus sp. CRCIA-P01 TaxID=2019570 RepID=UPI000E59BD25|nr:NUDIX domain-containing protein [Photorhabdus sp. CRCIA-P01]